MDSHCFDAMTRALRTTLTRRLTFGALTALALARVAGDDVTTAKSRSDEKKGDGKKGNKGKHKDKKKHYHGSVPIEEYWDGAWTTYQGPDLDYAGILTLTQSGINVSGGLTDSEGYYLPILGVATGGDLRGLHATMSNAYSNNITIEISQALDGSFQGTYYLPGFYGGVVSWSGIKQ
jgi:hypothetical protein